MAIKHHESSRKMQFFSQKLDIRAFERFACGLLQAKLRPAKNKTAAPPSEKQNAVLTLARDANYKSCRTQNSSRTFDVVAVDCGRFVLVRDQIYDVLRRGPQNDDREDGLIVHYRFRRKWRWRSQFKIRVSGERSWCARISDDNVAVS